MVAPIEPIGNNRSPISIEFSMGHKRIQNIIQKIYDEERKNNKKRSRKETEESWERFRKKTKKDNTES